MLISLVFFHRAHKEMKTQNSPFHTNWASYALLPKSLSHLNFPVIFFHKMRRIRAKILIKYVPINSYSFLTIFHSSNQSISMAGQSLPPLALLCLIFVALICIAHAGTITVYWGQDGNEGSLADTCSSGNY